MKLKAKKKLASRKNILIASTVGAVMLFGGVSAYYVNTSNQKANTATVTQVEDVETTTSEPSETPKTVTSTEPTFTPESSPVAEVTTSPSVTPTPTPTPSQTPAPVVYTSEEIHAYINQVSTNQNKIVLQNVVFKSYQTLSVNDYKAIINECISYLDTKYGANAPISTNPQRYANELVANVVNKYAN